MSQEIPEGVSVCRYTQGLYPRLILSRPYYNYYIKPTSDMPPPLPPSRAPALRGSPRCWALDGREGGGGGGQEVRGQGSGRGYRGEGCLQLLPVEPTGLHIYSPGATMLNLVWPLGS